VHRHRPALAVRIIQRPCSSLRDSASSVPPATGPASPCARGLRWAVHPPHGIQAAPHWPGRDGRLPSAGRLGTTRAARGGENAVLAEAAGWAPAPCSGWGRARSRASLFLGVGSMGSSSCSRPRGLLHRLWCKSTPVLRPSRDRVPRQWPQPTPSHQPPYHLRRPPPSGRWGSPISPRPEKGSLNPVGRMDCPPRALRTRGSRTGRLAGRRAPNPSGRRMASG